MGEILSSNEYMKQAVYLGKESIEIRDVPVPECGDDDILVKNIRSSICGTDVAVYSHGPGTGHRVTIDGEFGYETVSRVVKTGKNRRRGSSCSKSCQDIETAHGLIISSL